MLNHTTSTSLIGTHLVTEALLPATEGDADDSTKSSGVDGAETGPPVFVMKSDRSIINGEPSIWAITIYVYDEVG